MFRENELPFRHPRAGGGPEGKRNLWITACAGMTVGQIIFNLEISILLNDHFKRIHVMQMKMLILFTLAAFALAGSCRTEESTGTRRSKEAISISTGSSNVEIHTFCVDKRGRLLVAAGGTQFSYEMTDDGNYEMKQIDTPSAIHVFDPEGKELAVWKIEVTPQALAVGSDNAVYAAGMGRVVKLDENGNALANVESPHMQGLPPLPPIPEEEEAETEAEKKARQNRLAAIQEEMKPIVKRLVENRQETVKAEKSKDKDADKIAQLRADGDKIGLEYSILAQEQKNLQTSKRATAIEVRNAVLRARSVKSIAVTNDYIFLCTPPPKGYASEVWRMDANFGNPKVIVEKLSGCCGQMNIGAVDDKLVVPENGRFKVHVYDAEGNRLESWGNRDAEKPSSGFGSCCNPMNVAFDGEGNILTSEASVGAIKRFKQDGEFLGQVARSSIVPGCKHTPIGLSLDGKKAYMLDLTRKQIFVLEEGETPKE